MVESDYDEDCYFITAISTFTIITITLFIIGFIIIE